jgi:hypothetical protein
MCTLLFEERVTPQVHLTLKREAIAAAYLRAAHAYMLISMPTGTSTIFGVFQAIMALLLLPDELRPQEVNYRGSKTSPVKSFVIIRDIAMLQCKRNSRYCAAGRQNNGGINRFIVSRIGPYADLGSAGAVHRQIKTCEMPPAAERRPQPEWVSNMPRYFFNTRIGDELISDPEGEELRNPDRAWEVARAMIRELLRTEGADGSLLNAILEVTDDEGEIVLEFPFTEAILDISDGSVTKH